jgi:propanol-preferring alcohol dehydrogenase
MPAESLALDPGIRMESINFMRAMVLHKAREPLAATDLPIPKPGLGQVLIKIGACAICRTDLHVIDGELTQPKLPLVPGHEIVGVVAENSPQAARFQKGERVGIPWLAWTCGVCRFCKSGRENLCDNAKFTGYTVDGGYAEYTVADERFCFRIPAGYSDAEAAPLLCAGLIGYRSLVKTGNATRLGIYGFGAAAHIITQVARHQGKKIFGFTRAGDAKGQEFAKSLGATWAGDSDTEPPEKLDGAIIFAPAGELVPAALKALDKGGVVVCGGIHMSDIPSFPYDLLWEERNVCSVANLTRQDGEEFMALAPQVPVKTRVECYALEEANEALSRLRKGQIEGAAVLVVDAGRQR